MMNTKEEKKNTKLSCGRSKRNYKLKDWWTIRWNPTPWTIKKAKRTIKLNNKSTISKAPSPGSLKYGKLIISRLIIQPYAIITAAIRLNPKNIIL